MYQMGIVVILAAVQDPGSLTWHVLIPQCCVPLHLLQCHHQSRNLFPISSASNYKTHPGFQVAISNAYASSSRCMPLLVVYDHHPKEIYPRYGDQD